MKNKDKLLMEEAKRMMNITEYSYYGVTTEDDEDPADDEGFGDEAPADDAGDEGGFGDEEGGEDLGGDEVAGMEDELGLGDDEGFGDEEGGDEGGFGGDEMPMDEPMEPAEDEVELDVTELVDSTEEAKQSSDMANQKLDALVNGFAELQNQMGAMQQTSAKIDDLGNKVVELEHDIERRNPTPEEQIEMRSLDSYPYNIKLSDYWSEKEDKLAIPSSEQDGGTKEYTLTKQDVDDYSPTDVKNSFSNFEEDEVEY